jgi:hypothetical protein
MMSDESDGHQMATDFLRQVQSGQRARKVLETERSKRIDVDVPEELARTVLATSPNCLATRRTDALSHPSPTASSKSLLNGALPGRMRGRPFAEEAQRI